MKGRTIKEFPIPDRVVRRMNDQGNKSNSEGYVESSNLKTEPKIKYDWENYELD